MSSSAAIPQFRGLNLTWEVRESIAKHVTTYDHPSTARFRSRPAAAARGAGRRGGRQHRLRLARPGRRPRRGDPRRERLREGRTALRGRARREPAAGRPLRARSPQRGRPHAHQPARHRPVPHDGGAPPGDEHRLRRGRPPRAGQPRRPLAGHAPAQGGPAGAPAPSRCTSTTASRAWRTRPGGSSRRFSASTSGQPKQLPPDYQAWAEQAGLHQGVCDYVAGMTDRYAQEEYAKLFSPSERT